MLTLIYFLILGPGRDIGKSIIRNDKFEFASDIEPIYKDSRKVNFYEVF